MNLAELILWAKNVKAFDDRTYVGENITIADIKAAFNQERDRLLIGVGDFTADALREIATLEAERDEYRMLAGIPTPPAVAVVMRPDGAFVSRPKGSEPVSPTTKRHASVLLSKTYDLLVQLGKRGSQRELIEQALELAQDVQDVLTGDRKPHD